jgi:hypothetical protein
VGLTFKGTQPAESLEVTSMSMYRSRNQRKRWRLKWPWRLIFPLRIDERYCRECGFPFHEGPLPQEIKRCFEDNVVGIIFPAGGWRKGEYVIRVGRWKAGGKQFYCSEFIPAADIDNVVAVVEQVKEEISRLQRKSGGRRR